MKQGKTLIQVFEELGWLEEKVELNLGRLPGQKRFCPTRQPLNLATKFLDQKETTSKFLKKYQTNCAAFKERLVNISPFIYGKVYFPLRSNKLKELGKFVGASWTSPDASGLQSLVWRYRWEAF